jgi:hypothetical protein
MLALILMLVTFASLIVFIFVMDYITADKEGCDEWGIPDEWVS